MPDNFLGLTPMRRTDRLIVPFDTESMDSTFREKNMHLKSLKFFLINDEIFFKRQAIEFDSGGDLPILRNQANPALFLVSEEEVPTLSRLTDAIMCIGRKNEHKGLAHYFTKSKPHVLPLLVCQYSSPGKLMAGVKACLINFMRNRSSRPVMISSPHELFRLLWKTAEGTLEVLEQETDLECVEKNVIEETMTRKQSMLQRLNKYVHEPISLQEKYLLNGKGDYSGSEQLHRRALEIRERVLRMEHPDTLSSVSGLAVMLDCKGDYTSAELLYRRVYQAQERTLGPEHPDTLANVSNLTGLLKCKGDYAGAEPLYHRSFVGLLKISQKIGQYHPFFPSVESN
jgi:hypothetical protein